MKKVITAVFLLTIVCSLVAMSQGWQYVGIFPTPAPDTLHSGNIHGLAVDPDGKVWVQNYSAYPRDTIFVTNYLAKANTPPTPDSIISRWISVRALYCYLPNGQPAPFSPIKFVTVGGKQDTLGGASVLLHGRLVWDPANSPNTGRGLRVDHQGNILASYFGTIYRINYKTGAGMGKVVVDPLNSIIAPGVDQDGNIFVNIVVAGSTPLKIYDKDFNFIGNVTDTLAGFSRSIEVSRDGNDVYYAGYTNGAVYQYHSDNGVLGPYARVDTILKGFHSESFGWNRAKGLLWISAGSYNDMPTGYTPATWYAYNTATKKLVDSLAWVFYAPASANERPRAIAFSVTGDTAYAGVFGSGFPTPGVRMYRRGPTSVSRNENVVPKGYELSQNYPNPFNPSTEIRFTIVRSGLVTLKVFDMLGREVATVVNEPLAPGGYTAKFDASKLSSGSYVYTLTAGDTRISKKMLLLK